MEYKMYEVKTDSIVDRAYEFYTAGRNGAVRRMVVFYRSDKFPENLFDIHLSGILDTDEDGNRSDEIDHVHHEKVMLTVAKIVQDFLKRYPTAVIHCVGATPTLERLHQITVKSLYEQLSDEYEIYGRDLIEWGAVNRDSQYNEHIFFKKNVGDVVIKDNSYVEINCASARLKRDIIRLRSDPRQHDKEIAFFHFFMAYPLPDAVQGRLIMKRTNGRN